MAIADLDDAVNKCSGGNNGNPQGFFLYKFDFLESGATPGVASGNRYQSLWQMVGWPCSGSAPGSVAINPTNSTTGSLQQANASGGRTLLLNTFQAMTQLSGGDLIIADRLATISGLVANVNTEQTITGLSVNRYTGAESVGNEIWIEIYTAIGASNTNIKAKYTNESGVSGQVTPLASIGNTNLQEAQALIRLPLQAGDSGVRSVESITFSATTGTAGDVGVTIMRYIASMGLMSVRAPQQRNYLGPDFGATPIKDNACLFFYLGNTVTTPVPMAMQFIEE